MFFQLFVQRGGVGERGGLIDFCLLPFMMKPFQNKVFIGIGKNIH